VTPLNQATRTWLERGQRVPLQLELLHERHGQSVRVSVEMNGGEVGPLSALAVVPAAWFEQAGRASAAGDDAGALPPNPACQMVTAM
jgi:hypothetical protein